MGAIVVKLRLALSCVLAVALCGCAASNPPSTQVVTETVTVAPTSPTAEPPPVEDEVSLYEELAYEDCLLGAEIAWLNFGGNEDNYWMIFEETWAVSDPPMYPKNDSTYYACMQAYDDYLAAQ